MGPCLFTSVRSLLTLLLVCASGLGGMAVLTGAATDGQPGRGLTAHQSAIVLAERLESALLAVSQDVSIVAESLAIQGADAAATDGLLAKWLQLHPDYADVLFADRAGRVRATARGRIVGSDLSGSPWFAKALVGGIVGEAAEGSRAGVRLPRNVIVSAPVGAQPSLGVVAVQLTPEWADTVVAAARRTLPEAGRTLSVTVLNGTGRALHRSGPETGGPEVTAPVGGLERGGPGWLVAVRSPDAQAGAAGLPPLLLLAAAMGLAGAAGWVLGGRLTRAIADAEALCRREETRRPVVRPVTRDLLRLTEALRAAIDRSEGYERLLREKRIALARSQDRIRAIRTLSGSTCWEIDRSTGQVVWTDGDGAAAGSVPERACALGDVLAHLRPADRAALEGALDAVAAERGSLRDVIVATRPGTGRTAGRWLAFRVATLGAPETARVYALSREIAGHALSGTPAGRVAHGREERGDGPMRRLAETSIERIDDDVAA
ncbi:hypothetical protein ABZT49_26005 [Methylobacterium sp. EM32]|uniref:hypothetical protein n=1 Tax=Methylobacterium sp. EM32 TaxID=3163481 RepID=UPI0033A07E51